MTPFSNESQLLEEDFRMAIIKEIVQGPENLERKGAELKKAEIYNDQNKKWVMIEVQAEGYKKETIAQIRNRATNISVAKKIVNKLAKTYVGGVERKFKTPKSATPAPPPADPKKKEGPTPDQVSLDAMVDILNFNTHMKNWDRKRQLHRNTLMKVVPYKDTRETRLQMKDQYEIQLRALAPWQYDVIEDPHNKEKPAVVILSEFYDRAFFERLDMTGTHANQHGGPDGKDQIIADSPEDAESEMKSRRFIWWSEQFHFTTDGTGAIVEGPPDRRNPIGRLPFVNLAGAQDGAFWSKGGEDVTDGSVLINKQMTDVNFISFVQGWGQMVIAARNIPKKMVGGPDNAFIFEKQDPTETVQVEFATSQPPIEKHLETIRMAVAMLLSTNGLSTRHVAAKLDVVTAPSAIAMMVEDAEVVSDTKDVQVSFQDKEPEVWELVNLWWKLFQPNGWLMPKQQEIAPLGSTEVSVKFHEQKPPVTDKEKYETMKLKKEIGLASHVDLIRQDQPDLTEDEAKQKAADITAEKTANTLAFGPPANPAIAGAKPGEQKPGEPSPVPQDESDLE